MKVEYNGYSYLYKNNLEESVWTQTARSKEEADTAIKDAMERNNYKLIRYIGIK
jgi:hypothetical protein